MARRHPNNSDFALLPTEPLKAPDLHIVRRLVPYLWADASAALRLRVILALFFLIAAKVVTVYIPILYKYAVDALTAAPAASAAIVPVAMILAYGTARILSQAFAELRQIVFARVAQNAIHQVGLATFRHLHKLSLRFHLDRQTGGLSRAIERGTNGIDNLLHFLLFQIIPTLLELAMVSGILLYYYEWQFTAVTIVVVVAYVVWTFAVTRWRLNFRKKMIEAEGEANTKAIDSLLNYETVKYFSNEDHEAQRFDKALGRYELAAVKSATSLSLLNVGQGAVISVGLTVVMVMAAQGIAAGEKTIGDFVMINAYLLQLYQPLNFLGMVYREIRQGLLDMRQMFRLLEVDAEVKDRAGAQPLAVTGGAVEFEHVTFGYDPRRPILKDVSFTVPAGRTVAIVGPSGAGKSTISRLLFRFYDIDGGAIRIDGQDIRDVTQGSLRRAIGIVPQDTVLFNDSIFYNIAYGRPDAAREEVESAAKLAQIHRFVMATPDGYTTRVGERGLKLSGGERQRVSIARTILKGPRLLMFDEATSALDTRTEKDIQESLRQISEGVTTLVIAHRLSTIIHADEILVLDGGRIAERGRHQQLLDHGGLYADMWARQVEASRAAAVVEAAEMAPIRNEPVA